MGVTVIVGYVTVSWIGGFLGGGGHGGTLRLRGGHLRGMSLGWWEDIRWLICGRQVAVGALGVLYGIYGSCRNLRETVQTDQRCN